MAEPVNLNRFKKNKARADKKARAIENVNKFGRTKAEKELEKATVWKVTRDWSGKKIER